MIVIVMCAVVVTSASQTINHFVATANNANHATNAGRAKDATDNAHQMIFNVTIANNASVVANVAIATTADIHTVPISIPSVTTIVVVARIIVTAVTTRLSNRAKRTQRISLTSRVNPRTKLGSVSSWKWNRDTKATTANHSRKQC